MNKDTLLSDLNFFFVIELLNCKMPVSYTHLNIYNLNGYNIFNLFERTQFIGVACMFYILFFLKVHTSVFAIYKDDDLSLIHI